MHFNSVYMKMMIILKKKSVKMKIPLKIKLIVNRFDDSVNIRKGKKTSQISSTENPGCVLKGIVLFAEPPWTSWIRWCLVQDIHTSFMFLKSK